MATAMAAVTAVSTEATAAAAEAATEVAASPETATATESTSEAATTAETTATTEATTLLHRKAILANLDVASLPVVAIELLNRITDIIRMLEHDNAGSLGAAIRSHVDVSANDVSVPSFTNRQQSLYVVGDTSAEYAPAWRKRSLRSCHPAV